MTKIHIIAGFLGAGKSTAILDLFAQKPSNESWGIIINELGQVSIDHALFSEQAGLTVAEVPGGCICCASETNLHIVLQQLLIKNPLDRILIEPSGMGHLDGIIRTIHSFNWSSPVSLASSIVLVDIPAWLSGKQTSYQLFWDQIHSGDVLIGTKADRVTEDECDAWMDWAESIFPPKIGIDLSYNKKFKLSLLDTSHTLIASATQEEPFVESFQKVNKSKDPTDKIQRFSKKRVGAYEHGWIFPPEYQFDVSALRLFFGQMQHIFRAKGVFKTSSNTYLFNAVSGEFTVEWVAYNKDSRLEIIALDPIDWAEWEEKVSLCFIQNPS